MRQVKSTRPTGNHAQEGFGADARIAPAFNAIDTVESSLDGALALAAIAAICGIAIFVRGVVVSSTSSDLRSEARTPRILVPPHRVDIDRADASEIALLPEVGPGLAARIVADRAVRGAFGSVDALSRVEGIGPARIEAIRPKAFAGTAALQSEAESVGRIDG